MEALRITRGPTPGVRFLLTTLIILALGSGGLFADPEIVNSFFEEGILVDGKITGSKGHQRFMFTIEYNFEVSVPSIDSDDLECIGTSGDALGKSIPFTLTRSYFFGNTRFGEYDFGLLDASANGTYSLRIVENQVLATTGDPPAAVPAGEFLTFEQDITDPMPAILKVHPLEVNGEPVAPDGEPMVIEGVLGYEYVSLFIDFNKDVSLDLLKPVIWKLWAHLEMRWEKRCLTSYRISTRVRKTSSR